MFPFRRLLVVCLFAVTAIRVANSVASGQPPPKLNIFNELGGQSPFGGGGQNVIVQAKFEVERGGRDGKLHVTAEISPGWHLYSVTQEKGGPKRTEIKLKSEPATSTLKPFTPDHAPRVSMNDVFPVPIEEHEEQVVWTAPIRLPEGVNPERFELEVRLSGLTCQDMGSCVEVNQTVVAKFAGYLAGSGAPKPKSKPEPKAAAMAGKPGPYKTKTIHVAMDGSVEPGEVAPGKTVRLTITATVDRGWHVYAHADTAPDIGSKPTLIVVTPPAQWRVDPVQADAKPIVKKEPDGETSKYHEGQVAWTVDVRVPATAKPGDYDLAGLIGYQTCKSGSDGQCDAPIAAEFHAKIVVGSGPNDGHSPLLFAPASYSKVAKLAATPPESRDPPPAIGSNNHATNDANTSPPIESPANALPATKRRFQTRDLSGATKTNLTLFSALGFALLGGFILNFMPCVLPVIGLKVMAFVHQSHGSRGRVFMLNVWYSLGLLSVFLVLATFAAAPHFFGRSEALGWGEQFKSTPFNVVMASVVFVFALSLLGVWEIPIPGFVGSGKAAEIAEHEGAVGAFCKGVFTTILATPCTGPFMGATLTWAFAQPVLVIYATFACLGLGMALPYLLIGAFPQMIRLLPKPGAWMDTFKQIMGFVLLATVVFIFTFLKKDYFAATFALLIGLWAACWWIGRTPVYAALPIRLRAWSVAIVIAAVVGWTGFTVLGPSTAKLPWKPYSASTFDQLLAEGHTVLVDFTADW